MKDLGTLGGTFGFANWVNEAGAIVGAATNQGGALLAFLWNNGVMTSLGTLNGDHCSVAININSKGQVVGSSVVNCRSDSGRAFLWENGGSVIDLNTFVPPASGLTLTQGAYINDRGQILATGVLANGDVRSVLLIPCDRDQGDDEGCEDRAGSGTGATQSNESAATQAPTTLAEPSATPLEKINAIRRRLSPSRYSRVLKSPSNSVIIQDTVR